MAISFNKLMAHQPTVYKESVNSRGQRVLFVEHPLRGDEADVIVVFPDEKFADYSGFFELGEIDEVGGEYEKIYHDGQAVCAFEIGDVPELFYVGSYGRDCDGYSSPSCYAFSSKEKAEASAKSSSEWSDGVMYRVMNRLEMIEYINENDLQVPRLTEED